MAVKEISSMGRLRIRNIGVIYIGIYIGARAL